MNIARACLGLLLAGLTLTCLAEPQTLAAGQNQVRIAVMGEEDFHPDRAVPGNVRSLPDDLAARLIEHLSNSKRFEVLERTALRRVIREQQFGSAGKVTDVDRVIEKSLENLPQTSGWTIAAAGSLADHNDTLKEFQDLGSTLGADYLLYAVLEKQEHSHSSRAIPYSSRRQVTNMVDARLRLRLIETKTGRIIGARSLRTQLTEALFSGQASRQDAYSMFDKLGKEAAQAVLDMVFPPRIVSTDPLVINRGSDQGMKPGTRITLIREGKTIHDSAGVAIGRLRQTTGHAKVVQVQPRLAVIELIDGEAQIDDLVEPAPSQGDPAVPSGAATTGTPEAGPLTLAVGRIRITPNARAITLDQAQTGRLTNDLMFKLSRYPEFQLLERAEVDQVLDEKAFVAITQAVPDQSLLKALEGADYLVHTAIDRFFVRAKTTRMPYTGERLTRYEGIAKATARLIDVRSGRVASMIKIDIHDKLGKVEDHESALDELIDRFSTDLAQQISQDLQARRQGTIQPIQPKAPPPPRPMPKVNRPNF